MIFENPVTKEKIELDDAEAKFFEEAVRKFEKKIRWTLFDKFAFSYRSPIYARKKSYGRLVKDPLYRALQDMFMQLLVIQEHLIDDRPPGQAGFCRDE